MTMMTMTTYNDAVKYVPIARILIIIPQKTENEASGRGCIVAHEVQGHEHGQCAKVAVEAAEAVVEAGHLAEHDAAENTELILEASDVGLEVEHISFETVQLSPLGLDGVPHHGLVPSTVLGVAEAHAKTLPFLVGILLLGAGNGCDVVAVAAAAAAAAPAATVAVKATVAAGASVAVANYVHIVSGRKRRREEGRSLVCDN